MHLSNNRNSGGKYNVIYEAPVIPASNHAFALNRQKIQRAGRPSKLIAQDMGINLCRFHIIVSE